MQTKRIIISQSYGEELLRNINKQRPLKIAGARKIAQSIRDYGWSERSHLAVVGKRVMAGMHRLHALKMLGWPSIPVLVDFYKDGEVPDSVWIADNCSIPQSVRDNMAMLEGFKTSACVVSMANLIAKTYVSDGGGSHASAGDLVTMATRNVLSGIIDRPEFSRKSGGVTAAWAAGAFVVASFVSNEEEYYVSLFEKVRTGIGGSRGDYSVVKNFVDQRGRRGTGHGTGHSTTNLTHLVTILLRNDNKTRNTLTTEDYEACSNDVRVILAPKVQGEVNRIKASMNARHSSSAG